MLKRLVLILWICGCLLSLQAQDFFAPQPGFRLHLRVTDPQLRQVEVVKVQMVADTAVDLVFPEYVKYKGVSYSVVSAKGGLLKNNLKIRSLTTGDNMQYLGSHICFGCRNLRWISIGKGLKEIGGGAFALCFGLDSLSYNAIDCHVDQTNQDVWLGCYGLRHLHLGDDVETLSTGFISHCSGLEGELRLPPHIRHIGANAFDDCSNIRGKLVFPPSLESVGGCAFAGLNGVDTLVIQSRMLQVPPDENHVFYHSIKPVDVIIDTQVISLPSYIFAKFWGLRSLQIPNHIEVIPSQMCVFDTNLHEIRLPDSLLVISKSSFYSSGLNRLVVPAKTVLIENYAFAYNYNLSEVELGESIRFLGDYCFVEDTSLRCLTVKAVEPPRIFDHTFSEMNLDAITLYVPPQVVEAYRRDPLWNHFTHILPIK